MKSVYKKQGRPSLSVQLYQNGTPMYSVAKYFPETLVETPQLMWCMFIYRERYSNFSGILAVHHRKKMHNLWNVSDYDFPALNGNNSLCISSI